MYGMVIWNVAMLWNVLSLSGTFLIVSQYMRHPYILLDFFKNLLKFLLLGSLTTVLNTFTINTKIGT